ncbi:MAG: adenylyltransferase/cytidyltransferase family protein [Bacteroidales bacterium]
MENLQLLHNKIVSVDEAIHRVATWNAHNEKIVFTNGCFDIIHKGHVFFLAKAGDLGSKLIVGVNSDASVARLKGEGRPVKEIESRLYTLAAFSSVDLLVVFEEDTPYNIIAQLIPDMLVKGKDYDVSEIVGADIVIKNGGAVETIDIEDGFSSTKYINKIL